MLGLGELQLALGADGDDAPAAAVEQRGLLRAAGAGGPSAVPGVGDGGRQVHRCVHEVEGEPFGHRGERGHAPHGVARRIQWRAVDRDAEPARADRDQPTGDPALGRQADVQQPLPGAVVHPAGGHDRQGPHRHAPLHDPLAGDRVAAAVRQGRSHHRQVGRGDQNRALAEVGGRHGVRVVAQRAGRAHQVGQRTVAVAGGGLGSVDLLVVAQPTAGERGQAVQDPGGPRLGVGRRDQGGGGDRAGVDHRVGWPTGARFQTDGVEGLAAGLGADPSEHLVGSEVGEGQGVDEGLGDRLDGELGVGLARPVATAAHAGDRDAEVLGVGLGELRDVGGDLTALQPADPPVQFVECLRHRVHVRTPSVPARPFRAPGGYRRVRGLLEPAAAARRPARSARSARSGGAERNRAQQHARAATCTRPRLTGGGRGTAGLGVMSPLFETGRAGPSGSPAAGPILDATSGHPPQGCRALSAAVSRPPPEGAPARGGTRSSGPCPPLSSCRPPRSRCATGRAVPGRRRAASGAPC